MDPIERPYFVLDSARAAKFHGPPFRRPVPDPIHQDPKTLAIAAEQPLALHLGRLGIAATECGRGIEFGWEVAKLLWNGEIDGWDRGDHLAEAARRAGLDLSRLHAAVVPTVNASMRSWRRTIEDCGPPDIGMCPPWCSRMNPSLARTILTCSCGG